MHVGAGALAQEPPAEGLDLINGLLAGLLGFKELSPAELQHEVAEIGGVPFQRRCRWTTSPAPQLAPT